MPLLVLGVVTGCTAGFGASTMGGAVRAAEPINLLQNGDFAHDAALWQVNLPPADAQGATVVASVVEEDVGAYQRALRIVTKRWPEQRVSTASCSQRLAVAVPQGTLITLKFWGRSTTGSHCVASVGQRQEPGVSMLYRPFDLAPQWQEYTFSAETSVALTPGGGGVDLSFASEPYFPATSVSTTVSAADSAIVSSNAVPGASTVEVAGVRLLAGGPQPQLDLQLGHVHIVRTLAFRPHSRYLLSGTDDGVKVWDWATGAFDHTLDPNAGAVNCVRFSPDGRLVACGGYGDYIQLWDLHNNTLVRTFAGHCNAIAMLDFSADGRLLASASLDGTVKLWEVATGRVLRTLQGDAGEQLTVALSPDGQWVAGGGAVNGTIKIWNVASGQLHQTLTDPQGKVVAVAWSPDSLHLISAVGSVARLWDLAAGTVVRALAPARAPFTALALSPDGNTVAGCGWNGWVSLWDVQTRELLRTMDDSPGKANCVAFSPDGKAIASGGDDTIVRLWSVATGQAQATMGESRVINAVVVTPDGKTLIAGSENRTIQFWDLRTGELQGVLNRPEAVRALALAPDGRTLASGEADRRVRLWDVATRTRVRTFEADITQAIGYKLRLESVCQDSLGDFGWGR